MERRRKPHLTTNLAILRERKGEDRDRQQQRDIHTQKDRQKKDIRYNNKDM